MPQTRYSPATTYAIEPWDGSPESLAKLREFSGQDLWADEHGRVPVRLSDGQLEVLELGWGLYRTEKISLGAGSQVFLETLQEPPAA